MGKYKEESFMEKKKKKIYKRWWFWLIVIVLVIGGASSMSGDSGSSVDDGTKEVAVDDTQQVLEDDTKDEPEDTLKDETKEEPTDVEPEEADEIVEEKGEAGENVAEEDTTSEMEDESEQKDELQGSWFDSRISIVKNGSPELIPNITYDDAYGNFFTNPKWRCFDAEGGEEVVEFSGGCTYGGDDAEVYIQFLLDEDHETFELYYAGITTAEGKTVADDNLILQLIYTPFSDYSENVLGESLDPETEAAFEEMYYATL